MAIYLNDNRTILYIDVPCDECLGYKDVEVIDAYSGNHYLDTCGTCGGTGLVSEEITLPVKATVLDLRMIAKA